MSAFVGIVLDVVILVHGQERVKFPFNVFHILRATDLF
jgi:hypothetical protein